MRGGEIYAIAGVQGNGQTEVTEALVGLERPTDGSIAIDGQPITDLSTDEILDLGVGYVPEDRLHDGLVGASPSPRTWCSTCTTARRSPAAASLDLEAIAEQRRAAGRGVRHPPDRRRRRRPRTLSGGNQQKVVLARELSRPLRLLVVAQPTRGLDVGSMEFVHRRIVEERDSGAAVVLVSTELDEVLGLADRIAVMFHGRIAGEVPAGHLRRGDRTADGRPHRRRRPRGDDPGRRDRGERPVTATADRERPGDRAERPQPRLGAPGAGLLPVRQRRRRHPPGVPVRAGGRRGAHRGGRPGDPRRRSATSSPRPATRSATRWSAIAHGYGALFRGAVFDPELAVANGAVRRCSRRSRTPCSTPRR